MITLGLLWAFLAADALVAAHFWRPGAVRVGIEILQPIVRALLRSSGVNQSCSELLLLLHYPPPITSSAWARFSVTKFRVAGRVAAWQTVFFFVYLTSSRLVPMTCSGSFTGRAR